MKAIRAAIVLAVVAALPAAAPVVAQEKTKKADLRNARVGPAERPSVALAEAKLDDLAGGAASGTARVRQVGEMVTLEIGVEGLASGTYEVVVHGGGSCAEPGPARGDGPAATIWVDESGRGDLVAHPGNWSIGPPAATDLLGKPLAVRGPDAKPLLCGIVARGQ